MSNPKHTQLDDLINAALEKGVKSPVLRPDGKTLSDLIEKIRKKKYMTYDDKMVISQLYQSSGLNVKTVQKELGLDPKLILKYHEQVIQRQRGEVDENILDVVVQNATYNSESFLEQANIVKIDALKRVQVALKYTRSIRDLTNALKVLHDVTMQMQQVNPDINPENSTMVQSVNQQINNLIVMISKRKRNGKEKDTKEV